MIRTRLIGLFAGLALTSAMVACGSDDDSADTEHGGNAGASGHSGALNAGRGGMSNAGNGGGGRAGTAGMPTAGLEEQAGSAGAPEEAGSGGMAGSAGTGPIATSFKIRAENVSATSSLPTALSPGVAVLHTSDDPFFTLNTADRGLGLGDLAADANPAPLFGAVKTAAGIDSASLFNIPKGQTAAAALKPGDAYEFTVDAVPGDKLSLVTMFGESNDAFIAPNGGGIALFDNAGKPLAAHDVTSQLQLWDAGVEKDEAPGLGPTQKPRQSANGVGSAEGVVSKRLDTTRALPLAPAIVHFTVTEAAGVYTIAAKNVSASSALYTPLSPFYVATHASTFSLFTEGAAARTGLESLAEDGSPAALVTSTLAATGIGTATAQGTAPLQPGETLTFTVTPTALAPRLSLATMITQTNDVFIATPAAGIALLDATNAKRPAAAVEEELNRLVANWDAGTEANQVPGAGADIGANQATANQGAADTVTTVHRYADSTNDLANVSGFASVVITQASGGAFSVTISNTSSGAFIGNLSPVVWAVHDGTPVLFEEGKHASAGLESLAEDGSGTALGAALSTNSHVSSSAVQGTAAIGSGASFTFTVTPNTAHRFFSLAAMIAPSNDTFLGLAQGGVALLDEAGSPRSDAAIATDVSARLAAYDAGTEANQAGAAGPSMAGTTLGNVPLQAAANSGVADGNGLVRQLQNSVWMYPSVGSVIKVSVTPL